MKIQVYSTSWCTFCRAEKSFLDAQGLKYEDINIETDEAAAEKMMHMSGQTGVPFTVITQTDGTKVGILGYDQPKLKLALGLST